MQKSIEQRLRLLFCIAMLSGCLHATAAVALQDAAGQATDISEEAAVDDAPSSSVADASRKVNIAPIPIIFYTPESSLAIGGAVVMTFREPEKPQSNRPDSLQLTAVYTLKNQAYINVNPNLFFNDAKGSFNLSASYANWPTNFFGIDNKADIDAREIEDLEETYTSEAWMIQPWITHKLFSDFALGLTWDLKHDTISDAEAGGRVDQGALTGSDGGLRSGLGPVFSWDTRDHIFFPTSGNWFKLWSWHYRDAFASDFNYDLYACDLRGYRTLTNGHVMAFQGIGVSTSGEVPFNELPTPLIRGLYENVFVERNMITLQTEYRFPLKNRWSAAVFLAAGDVFRDAEDYDINDIKYGGGAGIRWAISQEEKINLRLDIGISRYGVFPYVMFQESF